MTIHDDELAELALGTLPPGHAAALARDLDPAALASEQAAAEAALASLAVALPPVAPPPGLRDRLMASARGPGRFAPFIDRLARLVDLAAARAQELLASLSRPDVWQPSPGPNVRLVHFDGGPACAGADAGFVRLDAGTAFPEHRHLGDETVLVLQGSYLDSGGATIRPGDVIKMPKGSSHHFTAGPDEDLIYAVVVFEGIEIAGIDPEALRRR
jgi:anti-sigma factor ChrR (cupin superfamily)